MRKIKTKSIEAKVIGVVPNSSGLWRVRMKAPRFPFYIDGAMHFTNIKDAEAEAEKWKGRKVVVHVRAK